MAIACPLCGTDASDARWITSELAVCKCPECLTTITIRLDPETTALLLARSLAIPAASQNKNILR
jgi:hypothetical protein